MKTPPLAVVFCCSLLCCSVVRAEPDPAAVAAVRWMNGSGVGYVAHRGANTHAPENTMAAFELAEAWGALYIEVDVRQSADGTLWIMHDKTVDRTTDGSGVFAEMSDEQIRGLDAGSWFDGDFAGERVPMLEEVLGWAKDRVGVYLDVKEADLEEMLRVVEAAGMRDQVFVWFKRDERAAALRRLDPTLALKMNIADDEEAIAAVRDYRAQLIEVEKKTLNAETVDAGLDLGVPVMLYTNKPDGELMERALEMGVTLFNIDHPWVLAEAERRVTERRAERAWERDR